jgi:hypothetical protein
LQAVASLHSRFHVTAASIIRGDSWIRGFIDGVQNAFATFKRMNKDEKDAMWDALRANPSNAIILKETKEEAEI